MFLIAIFQTTIFLNNQVALSSVARQIPNGFARAVDCAMSCGGTLGGTGTLIVISSQFRVKKNVLTGEEGQTRSFCRMSTSRPQGEAGVAKMNPNPLN